MKDALGPFLAQTTISSILFFAATYATPNTVHLLCLCIVIYIFCLALAVIVAKGDLTLDPSFAAICLSMQAGTAFAQQKNVFFAGDTPLLVALTLLCIIFSTFIDSFSISTKS